MKKFLDEFIKIKRNCCEEGSLNTKFVKNVRMNDHRKRKNPQWSIYRPSDVGLSDKQLEKEGFI
ncbi:hypothetical protein MGA3_17417 (plasmid) [Bacillus methanolicus MGA3]|nr:hypothetical protein MGA3_17417 [Bacillus methanolicus MGA3]UQD53884.1 hypothetical protein C0971_18105 [Bacillus methanolicus]